MPYFGTTVCQIPHATLEEGGAVLLSVGGQPLLFVSFGSARTRRKKRGHFLSQAKKAALLFKAKRAWVKKKKKKQGPV